MAALLVLFGSENLQNAAADGDTRTLTMHHMHTGEDISITFKRNGRYDDDALQKLNKFLRDWRREESTRMDPHLLDLIWEVYQEVGGKQPIQIVCGYRSPQTNSMLRRRSSGVARFSQHTQGKAIDFYIPEVALTEIRYAGLRMQRGGVGFYPTSGSPFIHLDTGSVRHWPRMSSDQLARVLSHGKRHPNHQTLLARLERQGSSADSAGGDEQPAVAQRSKRGLIQRLFGFGEDEDEEAVAGASPSTGKPTITASRAAPKGEPAAKSEPAKSEPAKPQLAAAVPLPPIRPPRPSQPAQAQTAQPAQAQYSLASVTPSPADIVKSRGAWDVVAAMTPPQAPSTPAAAEPPAATGPSTAAGDVKAPPPGAGAAGSGGQRFVWLTGPQGRPVERAASATPAAEPPRPPAEIPNAEPETTASLSSWPDRKDQAPAEVALAYAAQPSRDLEVSRPVPAPTGSARLVPPAAALAPAARTLAPANSARRNDNPWLRGLVIAPSVHYLSVAAFGTPDYRQIARLMQKPASALAMTFTADPQAGMTSHSFSGPAVAFLPTVTFATRTASLMN